MKSNTALAHVSLSRTFSFSLSLSFSLTLFFPPSPFNFPLIYFHSIFILWLLRMDFNRKRVSTGTICSLLS